MAKVRLFLFSQDSKAITLQEYSIRCTVPPSCCKRGIAESLQEVTAMFLKSTRAISRRYPLSLSMSETEHARKKWFCSWESQISSILFGLSNPVDKFLEICCHKNICKTYIGFSRISLISWQWSDLPMGKFFQVMDGYGFKMYSYDIIILVCGIWYYGSLFPQIIAAQLHLVSCATGRMGV